MMTTPNPGRLAAAMAKVQAELPKLERDRTVEVTQKSGATYSYSYATLANLTEAVLPLLARNGLSFVAMPGAGSDGKMCLVYHLMHESGETLSGEFPLAAEGGIQVLGGRITYARRYCLAAVVGIAADEDDESRLNEGAPAPAQRAAAPRRQRSTPLAPAAGQTTQRASRPAPADEPPLPDEPAPVQRAAVSPAATTMGKKMFALFGEFGLKGKDSRDALLIQVANMIGREITTSNDLTPDEVRSVVDALEKAKGSPEPLVAAIEICQRTSAEPVGRPAGQRSRNAREAVTNGGDVGTEEAPWDNPGLPV